MTFPAPLLTALDLAAERGGRTLFARLDVRLHAGELTLLRGPNGSGKTTLLRTLAGLTGQEHGSVERSERALYWGHAAAVKDELSAHENLELLCTHDKVPTAQLLDALARVGLSMRKHVLARRLSAGQRRRIGLAWLSLSPEKIWLLDEPTTALDADGLALLAELLNDHLAHGGTALAATHSDIAGLNAVPYVLELR